MQVWFEVPEHLRDSWADVVHGGRYVGKLMKNKLYVILIIFLIFLLYL